jgi:hypothetical protein
VTAGLLAAVVAVMLTGGGAVAHADDAAGGEVHIVVDGGGPLTDFDHVAPGETRSGRLTVTNAGDLPVVMQVRAVAIVEREDGCGRDEAAVDDSCASGDGAGELGEASSFSIWDPDGASAAPVFEGTIYELQDVALGAPLGPGASRSYRFDYGLPGRVGDDTQGDRLGFALELSAQERGTSVAGVTVQRIPGSTLAATGRDVGRLVGVALLTTLSGVGLVLLARRARHERDGPDPRLLCPLTTGMRLPGDTDTVGQAVSPRGS